MDAVDEYEFAMVVDRPIADDEIDALFDAGCDDAVPERQASRTLVHFVRAAPNLAVALVTALRDLEAAGLVANSVRSDDLVTLREIAERTGRTPESVRLLATGRRGPGGFPSPLSDDGWSVYSWAEVRPWFARRYPTSEQDRDELSFAHDRIIAAADHLVRARSLLRDMDVGAALLQLVESGPADRQAG